MTAIATLSIPRKLACARRHAAGRVSIRIAHRAGSSGAFPRCVHGMRELDEEARSALVDSPAAAVWRADATVLCRRPRRTLSVVLRGSVYEHMPRDASCPVLVVGPRAA